MSDSKTASQIRSTFLDYFRRNGHEVVPSSSLIPSNDPTLLFVNAGMVQFKDVFTGRDKRPYTRAASSQKCIRISGKHNDLENVGQTARHHTFFEMLGNFSFGDYFKEGAVNYAWELFTKELCIPTDRLIVSVFAGEGGIAPDDEARSLWKKVTGFGDDRIVGMGMKDNFWQMGETGPCGPCSEIHYYVGDKVDYSTFGQEPGPDGKGWVELWNLVFMQYERSIKDGKASLAALPAPCVDTGAGLERMAAVLQGVSSNYDTDLLRTLVDQAATISGKKYTASAAPDDMSMRVIADHARTTAFMIAEGVTPDRADRPYVLRRVMRRAIRHGHRLGIEKPFLHEVAMKVVDLMGDSYPELRERRDMIATVTEQEEVRFRANIDRGLRMLDEELEALNTKGEKLLSGDTAFKLHDTFGFPLDLTQVICEERSFQVDQEGFDLAMAKAKLLSEGGIPGDAAIEQVYREAAKLLGDDGVRFVGYDQETSDAKIIAIVGGGALVQKADAGQMVEVVLDVTPFYGESGGQVGDKGSLLRGGELVAEVLDTTKPVDKLTVHAVLVGAAGICVGDKIVAQVGHTKREATRRNHSATHLLHYALRKVLGAHAQQKGSLVGPDYLRFDFTHGKAVDQAEIRKIEDLVNEKILQNAPIETAVLPIEEAKKNGAMAIFGDKYGNLVRMLTMTPDSIELCGGTHARATGDIGFFKILSEGGIAAGVRRIEATTGFGAVAHVRSLEDTIHRVSKAAKSSGSDLGEKVEKIVLHERELEKQVADLTRKLAMGAGGGIDGMIAKAREIGGVKVLSIRADVGDAGAMREMADKIREKLGDSIVVVGAPSAGKVALVVMVAKSLTSRAKAGDIIRPIAQIVGGQGGGRPDMAQAGGTDVSKLDEAIEAAYGVIEKILLKA